MVHHKIWFEEQKIILTKYNLHWTMIYLYMLMMQAWDLDADTHSLFRQYLDVAIKRRKALQGFKEIVMDPSVRMYLSKKSHVADIRVREIIQIVKLCLFFTLTFILIRLSIKKYDGYEHIKKK